MALAVPITPATTATTATMATRVIAHRKDQRRVSRATSRPRIPTPADQAAAMATIATWSRVIGWLPPVTHTPDGHQPARAGGIGLDLLPQPAHVDCDRGLVAEGPSPDLGQQLVAGVRDAGVGDQESEKVELTAGQREPAPGQGDQ